MIDRASKRGSGSGSSTSVEMCIAGRPVSDRTFFLACLGVFAAGSLASWGRVYALAMATAGVAEKLRTRLFAALMLQEKEFFDGKKAGELAPILAEVGTRFFPRKEGEGSRASGWYLTDKTFISPDAHVNLAVKGVRLQVSHSLSHFFAAHECLHSAPPSESPNWRQPRIFPHLPSFPISMLFFIVDQDVDVSSTVFTERMASVLRSLNSSINASIALLSISPHLTMVSMSTVSALSGLKT